MSWEGLWLAVMTTPAWALSQRTEKLSWGVGLGPLKMRASPPRRIQADAASSQKCREKIPDVVGDDELRRGLGSPRPLDLGRVPEEPDDGPDERQVVHHVAADRGVLGRARARRASPISAAAETAPIVRPRMPPVPNSRYR